MGRGARHATMHRVTKSQTQLKWLSMQAHPHHWYCYLLPRRESMVLHTQQPQTTHISWPQFLWVKSPGIAQLDPWQDWSQTVWQGWGLIWNLTGGGSPFTLTEDVSKMDVLVVVGLGPRFLVGHLPTKGHLLPQNQPGRKRLQETKLLCNVITHMLSHHHGCIPLSRSKSQVLPTAQRCGGRGWLHKGMNTRRWGS